MRKQNEPKFKDGWGDMIKELREYRGYSIDILANKVGVSKSTISKWEKEMMIPELHTANRLAKALSVDLATIFSI